jgi:UDP-N-acetylmuramate dehydrogenase
MSTGIIVEPGYTVVENAALANRNTFRAPASAQLLIDVNQATALPELFALGAVRSGPLLILGEGSNVLLTRDWPGVVLSITARGIHVLEDRGDAALLRVEAGETWNDFVHWSLGKGFAGLENLILIPGSVGATPIQNIGAYGVEVREFVATVDTFDRHAREFVRLSNADCAFAYRDSVFKREPDRYLVTAVEFLLPRKRELRLDYAGVREELATLKIDAPSHAAVAHAVMNLRMRKLPNPMLIGNAGSFFKNPVIPHLQCADVLRENPQLPHWPLADGCSKLSAAWMIEACNFKGLREGDAGVSSQHALVLVNHGQATGAQILALAQRVQEAVKQRFGVLLEPEPVII